MNRRKGSITFLLLLFMTGLLALSGGFLLWMGREKEGVFHYREGLTSVYAAESGANWALSHLKKEGSGSFEWTLGKRKVMVKISENGGNGTILSSAADESGGYKRYVKISYGIDEDRRITVKGISSDRTARY